MPETEFGTIMFIRRDAASFLSALCCAILIGAQASLWAADTAAKEYRVVKGDNLYRISSKFKVGIGELMRLNNLKDENSIYAGMKLKIPNKGNSKNAKTAGVKTKASGPARFSWPVKKVISCRQDGLDGVKAIGLIIKAPAGAGVYSSAGGVVQKIGYMRGYGNFVLIKHPDDYFTVYSHLDDIGVKKGQTISKGYRIGKVDSQKNIIHFQIDRGSRPLNPLNHLPSRS